MSTSKNRRPLSRLSECQHQGDSREEAEEGREVTTVSCNLLMSFVQQVDSV